MHKAREPNSTPPFRTIVSSIGTYKYELAKYLCILLEPHIIPSEYCALDTFTFVREINELPLSGKFIVSFDVESLFTNIPLEECVNLAVDYISKGNPDLQLTKTELRNLFNFATAQTHFLFKGSFFDQIDGVAMGSPLARCWLIFSWVTMKGSGWKATRPPVFYFIDGMLRILFVYLTLNMTLLCFLTTSTIDIPTYVSPWKKRWIKKSPFWMF